MAQSKTTTKTAVKKAVDKVKTKPPVKLVDMVDEILEEIDAVLEETKIVGLYRQKGGE